MEALARISFVLGSCAVFSVGASKMSATLQSQEQDRKRLKELDGELARTTTRIQKQEAAIRQMLEGKLTLVQTARTFRELNQGQADGALARLRRCYPGTTEEEVYCRQVIGFCKIRGAHTAVLKLQRELQERLAARDLRFAIE